MADHYQTVRSVSTSLQRFAVRVLALFGWRVNFAPLPGPRGVVIVYPHTSNWDFVIGLFAKWVVGVPFRWLGKEALFRGVCGMILGPFFRACGGVPVERGASTGAIERLAQSIKDADRYWLALAPEGTRKYRDTWRSGFYHITLSAGVPLGIACIDYQRKEVRLVDYLSLSGDLDEDLARIRDVYSSTRGLRPELASPIRFADPAQRKERM
ncbi:MAG TPA: 1-acyl-sn-glycerol-3-phosphate acyltransferase [Noviherbaspirillum sp.]|uniref:1-acyl-sn-glycerol-3-phosphate acyltransferase n=1 Tax=Noviherbaspirillum sp. TaxID=1926288 RepID=UPI002B489661|nr:1-acyl-sn-glycerol-3-phosphate acyltransferase [Noviherbaspirillum sp.]HJV87630.1 1-acyl-sn-glycerol-3-phosphate acyltransferase [Noviherbaspirillum sp.]